MAKPRRKHPGFNSMEDSPQGETFLSILMSFLGEELWWKALEQTKDKTVIFLIGGSRGQGILVETAERAEEDRWVVRWGFRYEPAGLGVVVQMELLAHRWDPYLHAQLTGDRTLLQGPSSQRYRIRAERSWQVGRERDQFRMAVLSRDLAHRSVCGVPVDGIESALERHADKEGDGGQEVGMIRPAASNAPDPEQLLGGDFPLVD